MGHHVNAIWELTAIWQGRVRPRCDIWQRGLTHSRSIRCPSEFTSWADTECLHGEFACKCWLYGCCSIHGCCAIENPNLGVCEYEKILNIESNSFLFDSVLESSSAYSGYRTFFGYFSNNQSRREIPKGTKHWSSEGSLILVLVIELPRCKQPELLRGYWRYIDHRMKTFLLKNPLPLNRKCP